MNLSRMSFVLAASVVASPAAFGQVTNLKVVTDANPDYSDMASLVHSTTANWESDKDKQYALFYWNHVARRQTSPMVLRNVPVTDPIRNFNDYGFMMCSTISGAQSAIWQYMGMKSRYYEIGSHTVCEVFYDGAYHHYDNSVSTHYTLCDGVTIAGVEDIGRELGCEASGGKVEWGHIGKYHCLNGTSKNGWLEGSDWIRPLEKIGFIFHPERLKHQYWYRDADYGHRYIFNLRPGESYERFYKKLGDTPDYYVARENSEKDLETVNPRYRIRANGTRTWTPPLTAADLPRSIYSMNNVRAGSSGGVEATGDDAHVIFKVQGANVITAMDIAAQLSAGSTISLSTTQGMEWNQLQQVESETFQKHLNQEVRGAYDALVKVQLPAGGKLSDIRFTTTTQVNSKTQPRLNLGKNTVYVGAGEQTESIVVWPDLRDDKTKPYLVESHNMRSRVKPDHRYAVMYLDDTAFWEAHAIYKVDAPTDITSFTVGGRFCNRLEGSKITLFHSFDEGKNWIQTWQLTDTSAPWDVVHHETVSDIPAGTKSVQFKYHIFCREGSPTLCGIYSTRMEVNHKTADTSFKPLDVTFNWSERQEDYSLIDRSHTQRIEKVPFTYTINVAGADHPVVNSLKVNYDGAANGIKYGYSDGKDVGGEKWAGTWATYGKNLAEGKPYTVSTPSLTNEHGAGDLENKKLTDGVVGSSYFFAKRVYEPAAAWNQDSPPEITIDLGSVQKAAAFRIHAFGEGSKDAIKGEFDDKVEVLTSTDGQNFTSQGNFDFRMRWKDVPHNLMWNDEETFKAHNFMMPLAQPVEARYVRYKITPTRPMGITELQVLDSYRFEPWDIKVALPEDAIR